MSIHQKSECITLDRYLKRRLHVQAYLTLLDNYLPNENDRFEAFNAINNIPSIKKKADFCFKWMDQVDVDSLDTDDKKKTFLMNLITFASAVEGLFFFAAFAYVYYLRSKGFLNGLAAATNWIFRDESMHMNVAFDVVDVVRKEYPDFWDADFERGVIQMMTEAIDCEYGFAEDVLQLGVAGFSKADMMDYLRYVADSRLEKLGISYRFNGKQPFGFMDLQDVQPHTNFFERTTTEYQIGTRGTVAFDESF